MTVSSPPALVWTSWSPTSSSPKGSPMCGVVLGPGPTFQIWNTGWDAGGFDAIAARREVVLSEMYLSLDNGELVAEVMQSVVLLAVSLNFGGGVRIVEVSNGAAECVVGGGGTIEQSVEPDRDRVGNVL
jgi:hypothetical protein